MDRIIIELCDLLTFFVSTYWLIKCSKFIGRDYRILVCGLVYLFYIVPLGLDWLYQVADYSYAPDRVGFIWPRRDIATNFIYDIGMLFIMYSLLRGSLKRNNGFDSIYNDFDKNNTLSKILLISGMALPAFATVFLIKEPRMLYIMQWRELHLFPTEGTYSTVERFSYIGISCSVLILFLKNSGRSKWLLLLKIASVAFLYMNICIQGKRAIIFYAVVNLMVMLFMQLINLIKEEKNYKRYIIITAALTIIASYFMVSFTSTVKEERGYEIGSSSMYTTTRIDFLRDDRVRMAIYYALYPNELNVVDYPGQTFISDVLSFIPLNYISSSLHLSPIPYQTRFTYALIHQPATGTIDVEGTSWMTVSFFAELISNIGIVLGFLVIALVCRFLARIMNNYPYPYNALVICCFILMNLFDFTYISVFIEFTFILCWLYNKRNKIAKR